MYCTVTWQISLAIPYISIIICSVTNIFYKLVWLFFFILFNTLLRPPHGEIWRTMHCHLCINCYATDYGGGGGIANPHTPTHTNSLADSVTVNAKTTVHCSPDSSMARPHPFLQQSS